MGFHYDALCPARVPGPCAVISGGPNLDAPRSRTRSVGGRGRRRGKPCLETIVHRPSRTGTTIMPNVIPDARRELVVLIRTCLSAVSSSISLSIPAKPRTILNGSCSYRHDDDNYVTARTNARREVAASQHRASRSSMVHVQCVVADCHPDGLYLWPVHGSRCT